MRYVGAVPHRDERLGRIVVRAGLRVEIDTDLTSEPLPGRHHRRYEALSVGPRSRSYRRPAGLRLAGGKEGTVPVVIDDALGFTDPDRLTKMDRGVRTRGAASAGDRADLQPGPVRGIGDAT
jgi:hypothetical protein